MQKALADGTRAFSASKLWQRLQLNPRLSRICFGVAGEGAGCLANQPEECC
jgi:hypothetical protein